VDDLSVYVEGWVVRPGKYVGPTTLGRLVAAAGGISPNAWGSITIIRTLVSGRRIVVAVPVRGKRADLLLEPGDVVRVANGDGD
jgi:protein involved in polysaccharide export with SLBB domain